MSDIAVYPKGVARPTGGAGAVALLIGPLNGQGIAIDTLRSTCIRDVYDFYKPLSHSHYPVVDGQMSIGNYISSLDTCWHNLGTKHKRPLSLSDYDYVIFHTPYAKMVQKSYNRLFYLSLESSHPEHSVFQLAYDHPETQKQLNALAREGYSR